MEDLVSKMPKRKTEKQVLDVDYFNRRYGIREDGTTSQTASILAAAGVKPKPTEQAVLVDFVKKPEEIDSPSRPQKRPKTQNDVVLSESGISLRLVGDAHFRKVYQDVLFACMESLYRKTGKLAPISNASFVQALLTVVISQQGYDQLLVKALDEQKKQKRAG